MALACSQSVQRIVGTLAGDGTCQFMCVSHGKLFIVNLLPLTQTHPHLSLSVSVSDTHTHTHTYLWMDEGAEHAVYPDVPIQAAAEVPLCKAHHPAGSSSSSRRQRRRMMIMMTNDGDESDALDKHQW